jgi:serine-type D-Ala-D-Ala carboxypeptidase (penicillin-binding protein 5/6)
MISTLLSLYATGVLAFGSGQISPISGEHTMPWEAQELSTTAIPEKIADQIAPVINAKAAIAVDLNNGLILYEKNIYEPLPIASITKLMTAIIILEENDLKETVKVSPLAAKTEGTKIWLNANEKISVENLLYCILIPSANDAAMALAEHNSGTAEKFVDKMNKKAREIGLLSTTFVNPTGLDEMANVKTVAPDNNGGNNSRPEEKNANTEKTNGIDLISLLFDKPAEAGNISRNLSTAYDLTLLGRYAYGKSFVRRAVVKKEMEVDSADGKTKHNLKSTNDLLGSYLKVLGLKTGTTDDAGECLISIIENDKGHDILTVVLNSPERYTETKILADWVFRAYQWN